MVALGTAWRLPTRRRRDSQGACGTRRGRRETIDALVAAEACRDDVPTVILTAERRSTHFQDLTDGHPHVRVVSV